MSATNRQAIFYGAKWILKERGPEEGEDYAEQNKNQLKNIEQGNGSAAPYNSHLTYNSFIRGEILLAHIDLYRVGIGRNVETGGQVVLLSQGLDSGNQISLAARLSFAPQTLVRAQAPLRNLVVDEHGRPFLQKPLRLGTRELIVHDINVMRIGLRGITAMRERVNNAELRKAKDGIGPRRMLVHDLNGAIEKTHNGGRQAETCQLGERRFCCGFPHGRIEPLVEAMRPLKLCRSGRK